MTAIGKPKSWRDSNAVTSESSLNSQPFIGISALTMSTILDCPSAISNPSTKSGLVVIDFWAPWCGPCKTMAPLIDKAAEDLKVRMVKVNIDEDQVIAGYFGVRSVPSLAICRDGKLIGMLVGAQPYNKLVNALKSFLEE